MTDRTILTVRPPGRRHTASALIWALCAAVIVAAAAIAAYRMLNRPAADTIFKAVADVTTLVMFAVFGVTGALIFSRQLRNAVGWLLILEASLVFAWPLDIYFQNLAAAPAQPGFLFMLGLWFQNWLWLWLIFPILFIPLFFPTGKPPSLRWRWLVVFGLGLIAFFIFFVTFAMELGPSNDTWTVSNPIGFLGRDSFPMVPWAILLLLLAVLCTASLFVRFRRAASVERHQIKWLLYAAGFFVVVYVVGFTFNLSDGAASDLYSAVLFLAILTLPIAIAIAILRYRLYDIDVVIRKTLVYAVLTALLALVYFGGVVLLQWLFGALTGVEQSPLAVVVSTLAIAALFNPLRRRIQNTIDWRFFRKKYNARQVLAQFAQTARDETDLDALTGELARVVQETMQPERVSLWLKEAKDERRA